MTLASETPLPMTDPLAVLDQWTTYSRSHPRFDLWGMAAGDDGQWTRARFDGERLTLCHGSSGSCIAALELRQDNLGDWRARLGACALSRMGSAEPEVLAWIDIKNAFSTLPPQTERTWLNRCCDALRCWPRHG
jgi:hypothetical protein